MAIFHFNTSHFKGSFKEVRVGSTISSQRSKTLWIVSAKPWKKLAVELAKINGIPPFIWNTMRQEIPWSLAFVNEWRTKIKTHAIQDTCRVLFWDFFLASGTLGVQRPVKANEKKRTDTWETQVLEISVMDKCGAWKCDIKLETR